MIVYTVHLVDYRNDYGIPIKIFQNLTDAKNFCEKNNPIVAENGFKYNWRTYKLEENGTNSKNHQT